MIERIPALAIVAVCLSPSTILATAVSALLLDTLVIRPIAASVTTLYPGYVYTTRTLMQISFAVSILAALLAWIFRDRFVRGSWRSWNALSLAAFALAPLAGTLGLLTCQGLIQREGVMTMSDVQQVARIAVLIVTACVLAGTIAGIAALVRRERVAALALLGVVANLWMLACVVHFKFYQLGFDQDRWASP